MQIQLISKIEQYNEKTNFNKISLGTWRSICVTGLSIVFFISSGDDEASLQPAPSCHPDSISGVPDDQETTTSHLRMYLSSHQNAKRKEKLAELSFESSEE